MSDLTNHFPLGPEDGLPDGDLTLKAFQPANDQAQRVLVVQAFRDGECVGEREVPMDYPNMWGVDVADMAALERATDELVESLR